MPDIRSVPILRTERLVLRGWSRADREPFAALNADREVAEFLGPPMTREASDALVDRIEAHWRDDRFGLWAVERAGDGTFLGFCGLAVPAWAPGPETEVGWRLARGAWGHGYATEAARAAVGFGFTELALPAIVSYTTVANARSRRVMEKLGMARADPGAAWDFLHPRLDADDPRRPHLTYRLARASWQGLATTPDATAT